MVVLLLELWGWRTVIFQLSDVYCKKFFEGSSEGDKMGGIGPLEKLDQATVGSTLGFDVVRVSLV